jgi:CRP-like cAMP-binding protein
MQVIRDGKVISETGPGTILGEMALVDSARRNATLRAVTPCRVAVMPGQHLDREALAHVAERHRKAPE